MTYIHWIEIIAALTMLATVIGIGINRCLKNADGKVKGIGVRVIQYMAMGAIIPTVLILSLEGVLDGSATAALLGAIAGYLFSHIAEYDKSKASGSE